MTAHHTAARPRLLTWLAAIAASATLAAPAFAASREDAAANLARYQRETAACNSGQSNQSREDCLYEARSAYAEARRGTLGDGMQPDAANASLRCKPLPPDDRKACEARMKGQGSISGSVAGGGVIRELVTVERPAPAKDPQH